MICIENDDFIRFLYPNLEGYQTQRFLGSRPIDSEGRELQLPIDIYLFVGYRHDCAA